MRTRITPNTDTFYAVNVTIIIKTIVTKYTKDVLIEMQNSLEYTHKNKNCFLFFQPMNQIVFWKVFLNL